MHSDGVQAAGKIPVDVRALGVDLYSISGHKIYAPKGIGALYVRKGTKLAPMLRGGQHEHGMRAGRRMSRARWAGTRARGMDSGREPRVARLACFARSAGARDSGSGAGCACEWRGRAADVRNTSNIAIRWDR